MKQKIVMDKDLLFKDTKEIQLSDMQVRLIRLFSDNLCHGFLEIIKKAKIKRNPLETYTCRNAIYRLKLKTKLNIRPIQGKGFLLEDEIFIV